MTAAHPYRELPAAEPEPQPRPTTWWQRVWHGDDGHDWAVVTEPSIFRTAESELLGPFTRRQAWWCARRFVSCNPHGQARVLQLQPGTSWPPATNWTPRNLKEQT